MKKITTKITKSTLTLMGIGLCTSLSLWLGNGAVFAQKIPSNWSNNSYQPPKNIGKPTQTLPGGVRGGIINIIPVVPQVENTYFGVTVEAYPSFLLYIPELNPDTKYAQFTLKDKDGNEVYQSSFVLNTKNTIITVSLPKDMGLTPLEINQDYQWNFSVFSDSLRVNTAKINSSGLIKRVELPSTINNQTAGITLDKQAKLNQIRLSAESGIWYDTAANLAKLYREYPNDLDLKNDWETLLKSAKLNTLVNVSIF